MSILDSCVSRHRFSPWKSTSGLRPPPFRYSVLVFRSVALERGLHLDHRAIHTEVFPGQQAGEHPGNAVQYLFTFRLNDEALKLVRNFVLIPFMSGLVYYTAIAVYADLTPS